jgi:hypothetical protein
MRWSSGVGAVEGGSYHLRARIAHHHNHSGSMDMDNIPPVTALDHLLTALEFGTRKEDKEFTDRLLGSFGLSRRKKDRLVADLLAGPGFEKFFLAVAREAQPFARMLRAVYEFLSQHRATTGRRADVFRVSGAGARAAFNFDLDAFPKEIERILQRVESAADGMRLNFGNAAEASGPFVWRNSATAALWDAVSPHWDGDFYDDGFFRAVSHAWRILEQADPQDVAHVEAACVDGSAAVGGALLTESAGHQLYERAGGAAARATASAAPSAAEPGASGRILSARAGRRQRWMA